MNVRGDSGAGLPICFTLILLTLFAPLSSPAGRIQITLTTPTGANSITWSDPYAIVQHQIPGNSAEPWGIAAAPDGKVWFVEQGTDQLGSYDPATGQFSQFKIPTPSSTPSEVAVDSGGNVWFTELTANNLGELPSGSGTVREVHIPPAFVSLAGTSQKLDCGPGPVLPDKRGSVWIGCLFSDQVDEYFPGNGTFDRFDLPVFNSAPAGLALDGKGDLWFTAADAQMLGKATISLLRNGTSDGISEWAPVNGTYPMSFNVTTSFLGTTSRVTSSLPTPSGIAIDGSGKLWITEHVDTSFDSFDTATSSLVKYWTSQTFGGYGYDVSFPNGVAVAPDGTVWIGEHYGNKILAFDPTAGLMVEYPVPCCRSVVAGVYSVAMDGNGTLWFVEIDGSSIGEMVKTSSGFGLGLSLSEPSAAIGQDGTVQIPLNYSVPNAEVPVDLNLSVSGVSATGSPRNLTVAFAPSVLSLQQGGASSSVLTLKASGLRPGVYYLTLTAQAEPRGDLYSAILKLTVSATPSLPLVYVALGVVLLTVASVTVAWRLTKRAPGRSKHRRA